MTKMLPIALITATALITTAIVQAIYGLFWLARSLLDGAAPSYDWSGSLVVSGIATAVVLLTGIIAQRLLTARTAELDENESTAPAKAGSPGIRTIGTRE